MRRRRVGRSRRRFPHELVYGRYGAMLVPPEAAQVWNRSHSRQHFVQRATAIFILFIALLLVGGLILKSNTLIFAATFGLCLSLVLMIAGTVLVKG